MRQATKRGWVAVRSAVQSPLVLAVLLGPILVEWQTPRSDLASGLALRPDATAEAITLLARDQRDFLADSAPADPPAAEPPPAPPSSSPPAGTAPKPPAGPPQPPPPNRAAASPRGAYGLDSSPSRFALMKAAGFDTIMGSHYRQELDAVHALGLRAVVWLGSWSNSSCRFQWSDAEVRAAVSQSAGHPAVLAYYLGDEPLYSACPTAPDEYRARTALVHSLDPGRPTFTVIMAWDAGAQEAYPYRHFAGTVDILGLDVYPCARVRTNCDFDSINGAVAAAEAAGIGSYWGVLQAFEDGYHRMPTPDEVRIQFERWKGSRMSGYFVFSWLYNGSNLETHPEVIAELGRQNVA